MTEKQKAHIEKNIEAIQNKDWSAFFMIGVPDGCAGALYEAGIDFLQDITEIPTWSFYGCSAESIVVPEGIVSIDSCAFYECNNLERITLPEGLLNISRNAFYKCRRLKNITIPSTVDYIGAESFAICKNLESIVIPENITSLEQGVFKGCDKLRSITLPSKLLTIEKYAISMCPSLTNITIPETVQYIAAEAFTGCDALKDISYRGTTEDWNNVKLGKAAFNYVPSKTIQCTDGITKLRH